MTLRDYKEIVLTIEGQIGTIRLNRPKQLNSFTQLLLIELKDALQFLASHKETVFTVLTGTGRFFSAGLDVKMNTPPEPPQNASVAERRVFYASYVADAVDLMRDLIEHPKVLVMAFNGPAVGGGAAWFGGVADIVLIAEHTYFQVPFNALALAPENGSGIIFQESLGYRRAAEFLLFGRKLESHDLYNFGLANRIFPSSTFHDSVHSYLSLQLSQNSHSSLLLTKKLMTGPLKEKRMQAVNEAMSAVAGRLVEGAPQRMFEKRQREMFGDKGKL